MAGVGPKNIDFAEVHDCFTIAEICVTEALGFFEKGRAERPSRRGRPRSGRFPVNPSGGLKAKGHPVGATGVAQVVEVVNQLRGERAEADEECKARADAEHGRHGGGSVVHIFEAD